jgi:hypothetical protein
VQEFVRSSITALDEAQYETKNEFLGKAVSDPAPALSAAHLVDDDEQRRLQALVQSGNTGFSSKSQVSSTGPRRGSIGGAAAVVALADENSVTDILQSIKDDVADFNTLILGYGAQSSLLSLMGTHMCQWNEIPQHLSSDAILCVFHRSNKKNFVINWLGASVAPLKRAKASTTFGPVVDIISVLFLHVSFLLHYIFFNGPLRSVSFPITASFMPKHQQILKSTL